MLNQICKLSVQWTQRNSSRTARRVLTPKRSSSTITLMRKIVEILQNHWKKTCNHINHKKMWPNAKNVPLVHPTVFNLVFFNHCRGAPLQSQGCF